MPRGVNPPRMPPSMEARRHGVHAAERGTLHKPMKSRMAPQAGSRTCGTPSASASGRMGAVSGLMGRKWAGFPAKPTPRCPFGGDLSSTYYSAIARVAAESGLETSIARGPFSRNPLPITGGFPGGRCPLFAPSGKGHAHNSPHPPTHLPIIRPIRGTPCRVSWPPVLPPVQNCQFQTLSG